MQEQIRARVKECVQRANQLYGINMPEVIVRFDLKGRAAGIAMARYGQYIVRFNAEHIRHGGKTAEHLLNDTVPHEVAHLVCFFNPMLGSRHDAGWRRVCIALGGTGQRLYSEEDAPEAHAKMRPYVYTATNGKKCSVSPVQHRRIQEGKIYTMRDGGGQLNRQCEYEYTGSSAVRPAPATSRTERTAPAAARNGSASNAELVRGRIAQAKARNEDPAVVVQWAVDCLAMKRGLATAYVKNNWSKV